MKKQTILKFLALLWVSTLFYSCDPGIDLSKIDTSVQIDQSLVIPIGEVNVSIQDILTKFEFESSLVSDPNSIIFETNLEKSYSVPQMNLLKNAIPFTKSFALNVNSPTPVPANFPLPSAVLGSTNFDIDLGYNKDVDERMDSVIVDLATLGIKIKDVSGIKNTLTGLDIQPSDLMITLVFPNIKNGKGTIIVPTNKPFGQVHNIDILNFVMDTRGSSGMPMEIQFKTGSNSIMINPSAKIGFELNVTALNFKAAYGKFKLSDLASRTLTLPLDMLADIPKGLRFADPRAIITVESNMGSKLVFNIDYVKAFSKNNSILPVFAIFDNGLTSTSEILIKRATYPGEIKFNTMKTLDKTNGQTYNLFSTTVQHDSLEYKFSVQTDYTDTDPMFIVPNMYMKANINVQVPLQLQAGSSFEMKDSIENVGDVLGKMNEGSLVLNVTNALPAKIGLLVSFLNAQGEKTINDTTYVITAPVLDANGLVDSSKNDFTKPTQTLLINLTPAQTLKLKDATKMVFTLRFEGKDKENVDQLMFFTKKDSFKVALGLYVQADYNFDLLK